MGTTGGVLPFPLWGCFLFAKIMHCETIVDIQNPPFDRIISKQLQRKNGSSLSYFEATTRERIFLNQLV